MKEYLNIGSTPVEEECAQIGEKNYEKLSRIECRMFKEQLQEQFPDGDFRVKAFPHDFGTYHEVVAYYDSDAEDEDAQSQAAFAAESEAWTTWTPKRKQEIADAKE